ncbi:hypothetical protein DJ568_04095 [Mucilaginibacter hurinus]|uniref:Lipocalin-like domain-containing protein n=1 Tax=Mucilaginibacter hurinus TaxID=2201324 RepID=A0A367GT28_9SPHI|nr:hypothetical protein [Mucilaginibacter hurinus]RCH55941.1 hypothetical protein DJ568_04095 [Mucilaginibacter hurinus]
MKNIIVCILIVMLFASFNTSDFKGVWEYCGGTSNGKVTPKPTAYTLHRHYTKNNYEAFVIEAGEKPFKYEAGDYTLKADTCLEIQSFSSQASQTLGIPIKYTYSISRDTLTFKGTLPNGNKVEERWKKIK